MKYLAYDLGPRGIRVNAVSAGPIRTLAGRGAGVDDMLVLYDRWRRFGATSRTRRSAAAGAFLLSQCPAASPAKSCTSTAATTSWAPPAACSTTTRQKLKLIRKSEVGAKPRALSRQNGYFRMPISTAGSRRRLFPTSDFRLSMRPIPIAVAVVEHGECVLIGPRGADVALAGLWEFPGGKTGRARVQRGGGARIREETGLLVEVREAYPVVEYVYEPRARGRAVGLLCGAAAFLCVSAMST